MISETLLRGLEKCASRTLGYETEDLTPAEAVGVLGFYGRSTTDLHEKTAAEPYADQVLRLVRQPMSAKAPIGGVAPSPAPSSRPQRIPTTSPALMRGARQIKAAPPSAPTAASPSEKRAAATLALIKRAALIRQKLAEGGVPAGAPAGGSYSPDTSDLQPDASGTGLPRDVLSRLVRSQIAEKQAADGAGSGVWRAGGRVSDIRPPRPPTTINFSGGGSDQGAFPWWGIPAGLAAAIGLGAAYGKVKGIGRGIKALGAGGLPALKTMQQRDVTQATVDKLRGMTPGRAKRTLKDIQTHAGIKGGLFSTPLRDWGPREWALAGGAGIAAPAALKGVGHVVHGEPEQKKSLF